MNIGKLLECVKVNGSKVKIQAEILLKKNCNVQNVQQKQSPYHLYSSCEHSCNRIYGFKMIIKV